MPKSWSAKREHEPEHAGKGPDKRVKGKTTGKDAGRQVAAAQPAKKERSRHAEAKPAARTSVDDVSASRFSSLLADGVACGRTYEQLYQEAQEKGLKGRSGMSKAELEKRLSH